MLRRIFLQTIKPVSVSIYRCLKWCLRILVYLHSSHASQNKIKLKTNKIRLLYMEAIRANDERAEFNS